MIGIGRSSFTERALNKNILKWIEKYVYGQQ